MSIWMILAFLLLAFALAWNWRTWRTGRQARSDVGYLTEAYDSLNEVYFLLCQRVLTVEEQALLPKQARRKR